MSLRTPEVETNGFSIMRRLLVERIALGRLVVGQRTDSCLLRGAFGFDADQFCSQLYNRFVQLRNEVLVVREQFFKLHDASLQ